jgi:O-methyltransferase
LAFSCRSLPAVIAAKETHVVSLRRPRSAAVEFPVEADEGDRRILRYVIDGRLSLASKQRLFATLMSCRYVCEAGIAGAFVECGVWRGGNSIIAADVFHRFYRQEPVLLFDTFEGMTEPGEHDFDNRRRIPAKEWWDV